MDALEAEIMENKEPKTITIPPTGPSIVFATLPKDASVYSFKSAATKIIITSV